jgi:hypothetical protein
LAVFRLHCQVIRIEPADAGFERDGQSAAIAYTLIETAKLNGIDPQA